jgi:hypothetical protein
VKVVVLASPLTDVPVTVIVLVPMGVEAVVVIDSIEVAPAVVGVTDVGEKEHEAPVGNPDVHASVTASVVPDTRVAVVVIDPEAPFTTEIPPEFESEKTRGGALTVSTKVVVLSASPVLAPLTVIVEGPRGVDEPMSIMMVVVKVGLPVKVAVPPVNVAVAPVGSPVTDKVTGWLVPLTSVAVTSTVPLLP